MKEERDSFLAGGSRFPILQFGGFRWRTDLFFTGYPGLQVSFCWSDKKFVIVANLILRRFLGGEFHSC